ncbi:MAG: ComEC/Rec2 family competence protein [Nitrospirota bacterium]
MKSLECIVFNVEHGFSAFIKSPNNYGLLIDCGRKQNFSPIKWIRSNYNIGIGNIKYFEERRIAKLVITHLHTDHLSDIGHLIDTEKPKHLLRDKESIKFIDQKIKAKPNEEATKILKDFKAFQSKYIEDVDKEVEWGFDCYFSRSLSFEDAQAVSSSDDKIINNRSYLTIISYAGKKLLFPGDMEIEGWEKALTYKSIKESLKGINFFVAAHHGHKSGFTSKIIDTTGKPELFIVSAKSGDESVDSSYSKDEYCKGYLIKGDREKTKMVSTRERNASIKVIVFEDGSTEVSMLETRDNLNRDQKKILERRTDKILSVWNIR